MAGIFLADDLVIVSVADVGEKSHDLLYRNMFSPKKMTATGQIQKDLVIALKAISEIMPKEGWIKSIGIAMPGPIRGSGTVSIAGSDILTSYVHRKGAKWKEVDLRTEVTKAIEIIDSQGKIDKDVPFSVIPDAAAYALGEYYFDMYENLEIASDQDRARHFFRSTKVFAHLTIDEGVAGAVVSRGEFTQSRLHAEIGHLPLRYYDGDRIISPVCHAHKFLGCAESYVSLPAMRSRWGANVENDLPKWRGSNEKVQLVAHYVSQICVNLVLVAAPSHISLSGRIARNDELVEAIDLTVRHLLTIPGTHRAYPGYIEQMAPNFVRRRKQKDSGVYGCLLNAARASGAVIRSM